MSNWVLNPKSGRKIKVDGKLHRKLLKDGVKCEPLVEDCDEPLVEECDDGAECGAGCDDEKCELVDECCEQDADDRCCDDESDVLPKKKAKAKPKRKHGQLKARSMR